MFSYLKSAWTHILLGDVQRKDKRQKKEFSLHIRVFRSESTLVQKDITEKLCHLYLWWSQKLDLGTALGSLQSSPISVMECWGFTWMTTKCLFQLSLFYNSIMFSRRNLHLHQRKRPRWAAFASTALVRLKVVIQLVWRSWYTFPCVQWCRTYTMCVYSSFKHKL